MASAFSAAGKHNDHESLVSSLAKEIVLRVYQWVLRGEEESLQSSLATCHRFFFSQSVYLVGIMLG